MVYILTCNCTRSLLTAAGRNIGYNRFLNSCTISRVQSLGGELSRSCEAISSIHTMHGTEDHYGGIIIDPSSVPSDPEEFTKDMEACLQEWREAKKRGIWLKIDADKSHVVGNAREMGFEFHHAEREYIMMTQWLPHDQPNTIPPNASHQVGVGAFVFDPESKRVLVVQEKNGPLKKTGVWKMPTGLVQQGEDIIEAAEREVAEETGVVATFQAVLAMRQAHGFAFGKSDMFFVVALKPDMSASGVLKPQEEEIEAAAWVPLHEFTDNDFMNSRPLYARIVDVCASYARGEYKGLSGSKLAAGFSNDRHDLLLFGDDVVAPSSDGHANEDAWIGV